MLSGAGRVGMLAHFLLAIKNRRNTRKSLNCCSQAEFFIALRVDTRVAPKELLLEGHSSAWTSFSHGSFNNYTLKQESTSQQEGRCLGSNWKIRSINFQAAGGTDSGQLILMAQILEQSSRSDLPLNGKSPVSIAQSTTPKAQTSAEKAQQQVLLTISGAIQEGVPQNILFFYDLSQQVEKPKSMIFVLMSPDGQIDNSIFSNLMSLWPTPSQCSWLSPQANQQNTFQHSFFSNLRLYLLFMFQYMSLPSQNSMMILTWLRVSTRSSSPPTASSLRRVTRIATSLLTPLSLCPSASFSFLQILMATFFCWVLSMASLTWAYAPYPIILPILKRLLKSRVLQVFSKQVKSRIVLRMSISFSLSLSGSLIYFFLGSTRPKFIFSETKSSNCCTSVLLMNRWLFFDSTLFSFLRVGQLLGGSVYSIILLIFCQLVTRSFIQAELREANLVLFLLYKKSAPLFKFLNDIAFCLALTGKEESQESSEIQVSTFLWGFLEPLLRVSW